MNLFLCLFKTRLHYIDQAGLVLTLQPGLDSLTNLLSFSGLGSQAVLAPQLCLNPLLSLLHMHMGIPRGNKYPKGLRIWRV